MIVKGFAPFSGAKPFTIMGARYPPLAGAVLQALRAAAGDADHPQDGEDADVVERAHMSSIEPSAG